MNTLLIDVGNGRTKFALASVDALHDRRDTSTAKLSPESLAAALKGWNFGQVVACSVVPRATEVLREVFGEGLTELRHDGNLGIGIRYPRPQSIGPDRLANAIALASIYTQPEQPGVVIDFGTAVTFDVLSADHYYVGGVIAPGLNLMTDYLHQRTALLPKVELREPETAIGQSTEGAILAGAAIGYRGMVKGILEALRLELASKQAPDSHQCSIPLAIVATGGDAEWIIAGMDESIVVDPDLTLHGLRLVANLAALQRHA
jgi:type III pantothenate kinase